MKDVGTPAPIWDKSNLSLKPEWGFPREVERETVHVDTTQENRGILESRLQSPCLSHGDVKWQESWGLWSRERFGCHVVLEAAGSKQHFRKQGCPSRVEMDTYMSYKQLGFYVSSLRHTERTKTPESIWEEGKCICWGRIPHVLECAASQTHWSIEGLPYLSISRDKRYRILSCCPDFMCLGCRSFFFSPIHKENSVMCFVQDSWDSGFDPIPLF